MAVLTIRKAGDTVLKQIAAPVTRISKRIRKLLDDMAQTMYDADGLGLAAPQVGVSLRMIVIDTGNGELVELINPVIEQKEGSMKGVEGCLSIPGIWGEVERYKNIVVTGLDRSGKKVCIKTDGMLSTALQHEIDHLDGILFIEKAQTIQKG